MERREAKAALETARDQVAAMLGCRIDEIVFTSLAN
jgi:cysteine sulfinate desulfinase/cysteine desulfurase-like protein